jgi:hypothetical protein
MIAAPDVPERGEQYGLEVWQRIRHHLPEQQRPWWSIWFSGERLVLAGAAAVLVLVAFIAGRWSPRETPRGSNDAPPATATVAADRSATASVRQRVLLTSVADHLDRSERVLTDIMNAPERSDISTAQRWAADLVDASRLYRQDAIDAGEQSVANVLDDLERNLVEIVHSPSRISAADLEQIRRRMDAAALLFKVRVMSDELRRRDNAPEEAPPQPRTSTRKIS